VGRRATSRTAVQLKAKVASSQEAIENLLRKMEILSIQNNELTTKLENIGST
jgi:hypothetical protein